MLFKSVLDSIVDTFLPGDQKSYGYEPIDGDSDDVYETVIERINTFALLSGTKVIALRNAGIFYSKRNDIGILEKAKAAYDAEDMKKASLYLGRLLGLLKLTFEDVDKENRKKTLNIDSHLLHDDAWFDEITAFCRENNVSIPKAGDAATKLEAAATKGFPKENRLIITTDIVDKRRGLYKVIAEKGLIFDCSVPKGERAADKKAQEAVLQSMMKEILSGSGKKMNHRAYLTLYEKTGFDPRTFCSSLAKLVNFTGDRTEITMEDVDSVLERTRQDPVFILTNAVFEKNIEKAFEHLGPLLSSNMYPLQILAAIANQTRRLLLVKDFMESPEGKQWQSGMRFDQFQRTIFPEIQKYDNALQNRLNGWEKAVSENENEEETKPKKKKKKQTGFTTDLLIVKNPNSLYPVYQTFLNAEKFSKAELLSAVKTLETTDLQLKSSRHNPKLILEKAIRSICTGA